MSAEDDSRNAVNAAFRLINAGQFDQAESVCRAHLNDQPEDINILGLLGAVLLKLGYTDEARETLEKTIRLEPAFPKPYEDLGALFLKQGDAAKAREFLEQSIELGGDQASAFFALANACHQLGDAEAAAEAQRKYMALSPIAQTLSKAEKLLENGKAEEAEKLCEAISREHPTDTKVLRLLARIASESGRPVVAEGLLKRIIGLSPDDHRCVIDLGLYLAEQGRYPEAVEALRQAVAMEPSAVRTQQRLGDFLAILGKPRDALDVYETALHFDPEFVPAIVGRGHMQRIVGRSGEAISSYEKAIELNPAYGDAWWSLASLRNYRFSDDQVETIRAQIDAAQDEDTTSRTSLYFALARALEDRDDFNAAWASYESGNLLKRSAVQYDPVRIELSHDAIIEQFSADFLAQFADPDEEVPGPIFIVGMPRSGSTLIEQILASHSQVEGAAELPFMGLLTESLGKQRSSQKKYPEAVGDLSAEQLRAFGKSYLYYSRESRPEGLPRFTDKMPANFVHVGLIHLALPGARIIDARRHPLDTCIGNYRQLFAQGKNHSYDLNECAEYYLDYVRVMDHWDEVLPGRVLRMNYEDIVADLDTEVRRLLSFCGLPFEEACLNFHETKRAVNTASSEQVRVPVYSDALDYWKNYEDRLDDVRLILEPVLSAHSQK